MRARRAVASTAPYPGLAIKRSHFAHRIIIECRLPEWASAYVYSIYCATHFGNIAHSSRTLYNFYRSFNSALRCFYSPTPRRHPPKSPFYSSTLLTKAVLISSPMSPGTHPFSWKIIIVIASTELMLICDAFNTLVYIRLTWICIYLISKSSEYNNKYQFYYYYFLH